MRATRGCWKVAKLVGRKPRRGPAGGVRFVAGMAASVLVALAGCSGPSTREPASPTAASPSPVGVRASDVEPPRRPPEDFCERIDYEAASVVFGEPLPTSSDRTIISEDDHLRCSEGFLGVEHPEAGYLPVGVANVDIRIFDSEAAAVDAFGQLAILATVSPYPGGDELSADQIQYRQSARNTRVDLRVENLVVEVELAVVSDNNRDLGPLADQLTAATAAFAKSVLEALSAST